ncbi:MAG: hypothetical protein ACRC1K_16975 [Planctomycetia bacterium]
MLKTAVALLVCIVGAEEKRGGPPPGFLPPEQAAKLEAKYLANVRQVTDVGQSGEGYFSPDGAKILYQSIRDGNPFYQIYLRDLKTGAENLVSTGVGRTTCSYFHPTKNRVLFASSHLDPDLKKTLQVELARLAELKSNPPKERSYAWSFDPYMDMFECDPDGTNIVRLTDAPGYDAEGSYSPDGKQIVICSFRKGNGDVYIMDADGGNVRQITDSPGYDGGPFFSPDGKKILFRAEVRKRDYLQLFVVDVDGKNEKQLTNNDAVNWGPFFHPDGRHVLFSTSLNGHYNYELYLMNIETGATDRVTHTFGADVLPVFSGDGKKVLWTSKRGKNKEGELSSQLWTADWIYEFKD